MKNFLLISILSLTIISCGKNHTKSHKPQRTPKSMVMTHDEKIDVNYDARENRKIIEQNIKDKEANKKAAKKQREKQTEDLKELNENSSKVKKKKKVEKYSFY